MYDIEIVYRVPTQVIYLLIGLGIIAIAKLALSIIRGR